MTELAELGARLRAAGISDRALRGCFGVTCPAHVPRRISAGLAPPDPMPPATLVPWLLIGGAPVPVAAARSRLGDDLDRLAELDLIAHDGDQVVATCAMIPAGEGIAVCDRGDRRDPDAVAFPDDSTYHLLGALPRRPLGRWLDVGTGVAILPLTVRADAATGTDVDARALRYARLGARLSAVDLTLRQADLLEGATGPYDLITFNAPIPGAEGPLYRRGTADILERFWAAAPDLVAPDGEILVHARLEEEPLDTLPLQAVAVARYTPLGMIPAFGVIRWRPGAGPRRVRDIELRPAKPHVGRPDIDSPDHQG